MNGEVKTLFEMYGGIMRTSDLHKHGFYYRKIQNLLEKGEIEQIHRGYYQFCGDASFSDIPTINALFPDAVICMESALDYYGYADRTPMCWHLAFDSKKSRTRVYGLDYPMIQAHFMSNNQLEMGVTTTSIDGQTVRIFDRDRTICDVLKRKNKMDREEYNTAIKRYVGDSKKKIPNLYEYAERLHAKKHVDEVLGAWV